MIMMVVMLMLSCGERSDDSGGDGSDVELDGGVHALFSSAGATAAVFDATGLSAWEGRYDDGHIVVTVSRAE